MKIKATGKEITTDDILKMTAKETEELINDIIYLRGFVEIEKGLENYNMKLL